MTSGWLSWKESYAEIKIIKSCFYLKAREETDATKYLHMSKAFVDVQSSHKSFRRENKVEIK